MCSCDASFVCSRCAGTPFDPYYCEDDPPPLSEAEFEVLSREPFTTVWEGWK